MEDTKVLVSQEITLTDLNDSRSASFWLQANQPKFQTYDVNYKQYSPDYTQKPIVITPVFFFGNKDASDQIGQQISYYLNGNSDSVVKYGGSDTPSGDFYQQDSNLIIKQNIGQGDLTGTTLEIKAIIPAGAMVDDLTGQSASEMIASFDFAKLDSGANGAQGSTIQAVEQQYILNGSDTQPPDKTDSDWGPTHGKWVEGTYLWIRTAITYYNPVTDERITEYTSPYCDSSWKAAADGVSSLNERINGVNELIGVLQREVDGAIETWYLKGNPTDPGFENPWPSTDRNEEHIGDLYFDTETGKSYRYFEQSDDSYAWQIITDTELTQAMSDIKDLRTVVNGKVTIYYDETPPTLDGVHIDDLWIKPDGNFYQCVGTKNADGTETNKSWSLANISIDSVTVEYAESISNTEAPETGWSPTSPTWSADSYVWQRTVTTFKDSAKKTLYSDPVCISAAAARGVVITGEQVFKSTDGTNYAPSSIELTANSTGGVIAGMWQYKDKNGQWIDTNVTGSTFTISSGHVAFNGGTTATIKIKATEGDYYDVISLYKVTDGQKGDGGVPASSVFLTNENITFAGNVNGQVAAKIVTSNVVAYTGATKVTPIVESITGAPDGMTVTYGMAANNEIPITITVGANAELGGKIEQAGVIIVKISYPVATNLTINWSKVNTGATGQQGKPGINVEIKSTDGRIHFSDTEFGDITLQAVLYVGGVPQTGDVAYNWSSMPAGITGTSNTLTITRNQVPSARSFACAIDYDGQTYTGIISLEDKTDATYCNIKSSSGDKFTNGNISTVLTCRVYTNKQGQVDMNGGTYIYNWKKYHLVNEVMTQDTSWGTKIGKTQKITHEDVMDKAIFSCEIKKEGSNEPIIAYDEITIQNLTDGAMLFANCLTGQAIQIKEAEITDGNLTLKEGIAVSVKFANANAVKEPHLNIDGTGNFPILLNGKLLTREDCYWLDNSIITFIYSAHGGTPYWQIADGSSILKIADYQKSTEEKFGNYYTKAEVEKKESSIISTVETKYAAGASRGEQLVTNGSGILGNNTNFLDWQFDGAVANNSPGSFASSDHGLKETEEFFAVDPSKHYALTFDVKSLLGQGKMYSMLTFYDADKKPITVREHMYVEGTLTELAQDLKNGDEYIVLKDASKWSGTTQNATSASVWNYTNSFGYQYPEETYTKNILMLSHDNNKYVNGINYNTNTVKLYSRYSGPTIPANTKISQGMDGGTYKYVGLVGAVVPTEWMAVKGIYSGIDYTGKNVSAKFPPGTAYAKVGFLWNYNNISGEKQWITNVSVRDYSVEADIEDMGGKITEMGTQISQNSEAIKLTATKSELSNLAVGRNLLDYDNISGFPGIEFSEINSSTGIIRGSGIHYIWFFADLKPNTQYVFSAKSIKVNDTSQGTYLQIWDKDLIKEIQRTNYTDSNNTIVFTTNNGFILQEGKDSVQVSILVQIGGQTKNFYFEKMKLEEGPNPTLWLGGNYYTKKEAQSEIKQTADSINLSVKTQIKDIQIGGRNLLLKSNQTISSFSYGVADYFFGDSKPTEGKIYTLRLKGALGEGKSHFSAFNSGGTISFSELTDEGNGFYSATAIWKISNDSATAENTFLRIYHMPNTVITTSTIEWIKFEEGNKATDWTPALEDIDGKISQVSELIIGENGIQSRVERTEGEVTKNTNWIQDHKGFNWNIDEEAVKSTQEEFYSHTSPTSPPPANGNWTLTQPTWTQGEYIWRRTLITYFDGSYKYTPSDTGVCITGNTGAKGEDGKNGIDFSQGKMLYTDPYFNDGNNNVEVYNNSQNGTVTITRAAKSTDNPFSNASYELIIKTTGTASPGLGGFVQNIASRANAIFIRRFVAKIPVGYTVTNQQNSMGTEMTVEWLTSQEGTGKFTEYIYKYTCGSKGNFSSGGHININGAAATSSSPITWYLAYCTTYDMTNSSDVLDSAKTATNYMEFTNNGLVIGNKISGSWNGFRTKIDTDSFDILNASGIAVAEYGQNTIKLGSGNNNATIGLCNNQLTVSYGAMNASYGTAGFDGSISQLVSKGSLALDVGENGSLGLFTRGSDYKCYIKIGPQSFEGTVKAIELITDQGDNNKSILGINQADIKTLTRNFWIANTYGNITKPDWGNLTVDGGATITRGTFIGGRLEVASGASIFGLQIKASDNDYSWIDMCKPNTTRNRDFSLLAASDHFAIADQSSSSTAASSNNQKLMIYNDGPTYLKGTTAIHLYGQTNNENTADNFIAITENVLRPHASGVFLLGHNSQKWNSVITANLYAGVDRDRIEEGVIRAVTIFNSTGAISSSDRNKKKNIESLDSRYVLLFNKLQPVKYNFTRPKSDRIHIGFVSQDIEQAMNEVGLTDLEFGGFCKDIKRIQKKRENPNEEEELYYYEDELDENGELVYEYSLRYQEFIALNTKMIQLNQQRIESLEEEVEQLKLQLSRFENSLNL